MEKYSRLNVKELKGPLIKRNAKTNSKISELVKRLMVLDNVRQSSHSGQQSSGCYEGEDVAQWPDPEGFIAVGSSVPKNDINIAKVGVYFQTHNTSVSRGSKVQKSE